MTPSPSSLSDEELIRYTILDPRITERERVLVGRLEMALDYIAEIQEFLIKHNLAEEEIVSIQ